MRIYELPFGIEKYSTEDRYYATRCGKIFYGREHGDTIEIEPYMKNGKSYVKLFDEEYYLPKVLLIAWTGDIDLEVQCKDEYDPNSRNTSYRINDEDLVISDNCICIKEIEFKKISNYSNYYISNSGMVFDLNNRMFVSHKLNGDSYHTVCLFKNGKFKTPTIHRLVYNTFVGEIPEGMELDHLYSKSRNGVDDVEIVTHQENIRRAQKAGCYKGNYTEEDVIEICELLQAGHQAFKICNMKGLYKGDPDYDRFLSFIYHIRNKETWKDVSDKYNFPPTKIGGGRTRSDEDIHKICQMLQDGYTQQEIANEMGINRQYVSDIRRGLIRKEISKNYDFSNCRKRGEQRKENN